MSNNELHIKIMTKWFKFKESGYWVKVIEYYNDTYWVYDTENGEELNYSLRDFKDAKFSNCPPMVSS